MPPMTTNAYILVLSGPKMRSSHDASVAATIPSIVAE